MVMNFYENVLDVWHKNRQTISNVWFFLSIEYRNDMQQINFRSNFQHSGNRILQSFALRTVPIEISEIAKKYLAANVEQSMFVSQFSKIISKCFNDDVTLV